MALAAKNFLSATEGPFSSPCQVYKSQVFTQTEVFLKTHCVSPQQYQLLNLALHGLETGTQEEEVLPFIFVPRLICAGLTDDKEKSLPLSVATTLLFLGIDILDDIADGDLPDYWQGHSISEINLAAATLLASLPQIALSELEVSETCRDAMQRILAQGLLRMSAGQQQDLVMNGQRNVSSQDIESSVAAKSGEEVAIFAALAAQFSGAAPHLITLYANMGKAMGTAGQLASDCHDLFQAAHSKDLANGTRTFPIALYLEKKTPEEKTIFLNLLARAKKGDAVIETIRDCLHRSGILRLCAFVVEVYCQRALTLLKKASPGGVAAADWAKLILHISFFKGGNHPENTFKD